MFNNIRGSEFYNTNKSLFDEINQLNQNISNVKKKHGKVIRRIAKPVMRQYSKNKKELKNKMDELSNKIANLNAEELQADDLKQIDSICKVVNNYYTQNFVDKNREDQISDNAKFIMEKNRIKNQIKSGKGKELLDDMIKSRNLDGLSALSKEGIKPDANDLYKAVDSRDWDLVKFLWEAEVNPNEEIAKFTPGQAKTPIELATNKFEMAKKEYENIRTSFEKNIENDKEKLKELEEKIEKYPIDSEEIKRHKNVEKLREEPKELFDLKEKYNALKYHIEEGEEKIETLKKNLYECELIVKLLG